MTDPNRLHELYTNLQKRLGTDLETARAANKNVNVKGDESELTWLQLLDQHLPHRYKAVKGIVIDCNASGISPELAQAIQIYKSLKPGTIYIIPVRFSECEIPALEIGPAGNLAALQCTDLFPSTGRRTAVGRIVAAIRAAQQRVSD